MDQAEGAVLKKINVSEDRGQSEVLGCQLVEIQPGGRDELTKNDTCAFMALCKCPCSGGGQSENPLKFGHPLNCCCKNGEV